MLESSQLITNDSVLVVLSRNIYKVNWPPIFNSNSFEKWRFTKQSQKYRFTYGICVVLAMEKETTM